MTERELVQGCKQGRREAQRELYARTCEHIHRLLLRMTRNPDDTLDLVQSTYLRAFERIQQFDGTAQLSSWLYRIAVNEGLQFLRQHRRQDHHLRIIREQSTVQSGENTLDARLDVAAALARLPQEEETLIVLRHFEGLSYDEMAELLGKPAGTIASGLNRARQNLRNLLEPAVALERVKKR